jgi:hypothetical protein
MGRPKKGPIWLIVHADALAQVSESGKRDFEGELKGNFLDKLQCPTADDVLIALRRCFSLAYPDEHSDEGCKQAVARIRDVARAALMPVGDDLLTSLRLQPVGQPPPERKIKVHVFLFVFARKADLDIKALHEGKPIRLLNSLEHWPADDLIVALRRILTVTFSEMYTADQHLDALYEVRHLVANVLLPYNELLEAIEVEPIAQPTKEQPDRDEEETES